MKLIAVSCSHCGAPLEVPKSANLVTCAFCDTRLSVQRTESTYSTTAIEQLGEATASLAQELAHTRMQKQLDDLREGWKHTFSQLCVKYDDGTTYVPNAKLGGLTAIIGAIIAACLLVFGMASPAVPAVVVGLLTLVLTFCHGMQERANARRYKQALAEFRSREAELQSQIAAIRK